MLIQNADRLYLGTTEIDRVYLGDKQKFPPFVMSKNNLTDGGLLVGDFINKDMQSAAFLSNDNILPGTGSLNSTRSYWQDWGNDIFDAWGFFYIYNTPTNQFLSPVLQTVNQADGVIATETFTFAGRTFTIKHGYPVQGIYKFEVTVDDDQDFIFGADGNMGSNGTTQNTNLTQAYTLGSRNLNLYYNRNIQGTVPEEALYSYFVPYELSKNNSITYSKFVYSTDSLAMYSVNVKHGLTVYFAKRYDVKNWVINDLKLGVLN